MHQDKGPEKAKKRGLSSSETKKKRLAALEAKRKGSSGSSAHRPGPVVSSSSKEIARSRQSGKELAEEIDEKAAYDLSHRVDESPSVDLYSTYEGTIDAFPWIEDDQRSLQDVVGELLETNPRCRHRHASGIVDKMKEKTLLLDNPDAKRNKQKERLYVKNAGIRKATRKELKELGALNVNEMNVTYKDALRLHEMWKEYRDALLECTTSKKDMNERLHTMDTHGAYVVFKILNNKALAQDKQVSGILVADTQTSIHVLDEKGKCHIASKTSSEYSIGISAERKLTVLPPLGRQ